MRERRDLFRLESLFEGVQLLHDLELESVCLGEDRCKARRNQRSGFRERGWVTLST